MTIKVLHLIGGGEIGGAEENVLNLMHHFQRDKICPCLGCLSKSSPFASLVQSQGISTEIFPMRFSLDLYPIIPLVKFCRRSKIEILHCHGIRANLIGRLAAKILGIPCISTVHSHLESDYTASWKGKIALFLDNSTLPLASAVITVSNDLRNTVSRRLQKKGLTPPLKTIYNGYAVLDFSEKDQLRNSFRKKYQIPQDCTVVGTIGRLHPVKGQSYLVEGIKLLAKEFPNLHLLIIGDGPLYNPLQELLEVSQLSYTMTGYLPSAWQALPAMDLFVLPSLNEGMGLVLLEAAQAEVPIVASRVGGIPELLTDESEALLTEPAVPLDITLACSRLLNDEALVNKLISNAASKASMFTLEKMAEATTIFYEQTLYKN